MAGIDTTSPHYKGKYASIYEVNADYPNGGSAGDYVDIQGFAHYWNPDRNNWCVNEERDEYWDELLAGAVTGLDRLDKALAEETSERIAEDEILSKAIENANNAIQENYEKILEETEGRTAADEELRERINEEVAAREEADNKLNEEISKVEERLSATELITEEFKEKLPELMSPEQYEAPEKIKGALTNYAIGAIPAGTNVSDLDGKTFSQIISMMLVVPEWPDVPKHEVRFDAIDTAVIKVGNKIEVPRFNATWNPSIVAVGGAPDATVYCRYQMTTPSGISKYAITGNNSLLEGEAFWEDTIIGDSVGKYIFSLYITHGTGEVTLESTNIDIEKTVLINSEEKVMEQTVEVTYPWYINDQEQPLVPLGESKTVVRSYEKSPRIRVPFPSSIISVKADIGNGFLPVANWASTIEMDDEYAIPYKVYYGEDSFNEPVKHEITINLAS